MLVWKNHLAEFTTVLFIVAFVIWSTLAGINVLIKMVAEVWPF